MSDLADEIRSMVFAFDANDGRREAVRKLADRVEVMHEALCNVINRWTRHKVGFLGENIADGADDLNNCQCSRCLAIDATPFDERDPLPFFFTEAEYRAALVRRMVAEQWATACVMLATQPCREDTQGRWLADLSFGESAPSIFAKMPCAVDTVGGAP